MIDFKILNAIYGGIDCKDKITEIIGSSNICKIENNIIGMDPNKGIKKEFIIDYIYNGETLHKKLFEGDIFVLKNLKSSIIEFIIPTYNRKNELSSMLSSLCAQKSSNWKALVVIDDNIKHLETENIISFFKDERISFIYCDKQYNDFGHTPREIGKQKSTADYIIMTGDDNYYVPSFISELNILINDKPGLIYWDMIHNQYNYEHFKCELMFNYIDIGSFAVRRDLAQQIELGKISPSDGVYIQDFCKKFPDEKKEKINKILFVHN
jgi:hypothetical protein